MRNESLCVVNNLGLRYHRGERAVLEGLSLSLSKGEIVGIRGKTEREKAAC